MNAYFRIVNAFVEDTCVLIVVAYLLARGRMLGLLFAEHLNDRKALLLGGILGLVGLTEAAFPGARFPYVTSTLIITFASLTCGLRVGLIAAAVMTLGALLFQSPSVVAATMLTFFASAFVGEGIGRLCSKDRHLPLCGLAAGTCAQGVALALRSVLSGIGLQSGPFTHAIVTVPANGFGVLLLMVVANDARVRAEGERLRAEAERAHALVAEAQLTALRARIHPHFLFNTLTSISALCGIAPDRAETAILRLSQLMRRALESSPAAPLCLSEELEYVQGYLEIEQQRLGARLLVTLTVDPRCAPALVPAFAVQTLVENAVNHGIAPKVEPGTIRILARRYPDHALIAVADDGVGIEESVQRDHAAGGTREHGLQILTQQLVLLYGRSARLRLFSRPNVGTLAVFIIPLQERIPEMRSA